MRPKVSGAGLVCRTDQYFQCQRLALTMLTLARYCLSNIIFFKNTKFKSNVFEAISKLILENSKNHFSILVLPAIQAYETTIETTRKTTCAVTSRLLT